MNHKAGKYITIYEEVRNDIIDGRYPVGTKLPSKRVMAEAMGVSVITIEHAYELLDEEGYILSKEKVGYIVCYDEQDSFSSSASIRANSFHAKRDGGIVSGNANSGVIQKTDDAPENKKVEFSAAIYAKTARQVLSYYRDEVMERSPHQGTEILRNAIADYLNRARRIKVSPEQIYVGSGAEYLYGLIVQTLGRNMIYGVESPSYMKIAQVYEAAGASIELLPLCSDGIDSQALKESSARVLHITPYRSFPSGVSASASKKREYLRWSCERSGIIIEDDFESEFTPSRKPAETLFSLDENDRVIYVNTFTQTIGPSVRTAYMVVPAALRGRVEEKIGFYSCPVPTLEQYVLAQLINNGDFERHINKVRRYNRQSLTK